MKKCVSFATTSTLMTMIVVHSVVGLRHKPKPASSPERAAVLELFVDTDDSCRLILMAKMRASSNRIKH